MEIEQFVIGRGGIDLEIAGVDHDAEGRGDGQGDGAHDGVRDVDELDLEGADFDDLFGLDVDESRLLSSSCSSRRRSTSASVKSVP